MSVIIFLVQVKTFFFAEMMCKQLIFCVRAATRLFCIKMRVYATIKVTERSKGVFSRLLMDHYMIALENTTFLDCFKSFAMLLPHGLVTIHVNILSMHKHMSMH